MRSFLEAFRRLSPVARLIAALFVAYSLFHFARAAVYLPFVHHGMMQASQEARPIQQYILKGRPVGPGNFRQYGPTFLFVMHPFLKWAAGADPGHLDLSSMSGPPGLVTLSRSLLVLELLSTVLACGFVLASIRLWLERLARPPTADVVCYVQAAVVLVWLNFTPLYEVIDVKTVEPWELCLLSGALYAHLRGPIFWTGFCVAAAALMKWLPGFFFFYLLLRDRRAFVYGCVCVLALLSISHLIYGPALGLQYPLLVVKAGSGPTQGFLGHQSFSFKSLIAKALGEFQSPGVVPAYRPVPDYFSGWDVMISPERLVIANALGNLCSLLLVGWTVWALLLRTRTGNWAYDEWWDWSVVLAVMFLVPPVTSYEYATLVLPAYSFGTALLILEGWKRGHGKAAALFVVSMLLVGNIVPRALVHRLVLIETITRMSSFSHFNAAQAYYSVGFPFYGVLLLLGALWFWRSSARASTS